MNTAATTDDLMDLHDELKNSMKAMTFSAAQVRRLREAFAVRADELDPPPVVVEEVAGEKLSEGVINKAEYAHILKMAALIRDEEAGLNEEALEQAATSSGGVKTVDDGAGAGGAGAGATAGSRPGDLEPV